MKKHTTRSLLCCLFMIVAAMSCEDEIEENPINLPCFLKEVELYHLDNTGERPAEPVGNKIPKEAYMLEIRLLTEISEDDIDSYYNFHPTRHVLTDGIKKIQILTETIFSSAFPEGAEVTSCFVDYPKFVLSYQQTDLTVHGEVIRNVDKTNRIIKVLLTIPQPGKYSFRVVLTKESGECVVRTTTPISLY